MDRTRTALRQMAQEDPELAARLVLQALPAAITRIPPPLEYELTVAGLGSWRIAVHDGDARMEPSATSNGGRDGLDFRLETDPAGLAAMAAGTSPLRLMLGGRLRIRGKRRRALKLRAMANGEDVSIAEAAAAGAEIDPDAIFHALEYLIDPEWTRGHRFTVAYEIAPGADGAGVGTWCVRVDDGERLQVSTGSAADGGPDATVKLDFDTYKRLIGGDITPAQGMREQLTDIEGEIYPVTLLGRWIDRSQGRDDAELAREQHQREIQARRAGTWGGIDGNGAGDGSAAATAVKRSVPLQVEGATGDGDGGAADPALAPPGGRRASGDLMSYGELYALWERQNWRVHELDFSLDREQWVTTPQEAQENTAWSLGSFYIGEERVTADLAPFLLAAPSGEVEVFLATQLVDEARHAAFFDRFGAEVMALESDDLRTRMRELEAMMMPPWFETFDDGLRDVANRIKASPDDLDLFVEGITTYHLVIEGVLATTGQRMILKYVEDHGLYPGFQKGFSLVEQDEHRHIAFGVRFLRDAIAEDPRYAETVERTVADLVPKAAHVFCPPYAEDPSDFVSYGYHSSYVYGYAYRKLKRRMKVLGLETPPAEELMPGPIASPDDARAAGMPV